MFKGGTIGLFTGMSFLSMIEVIFWILKISTTTFCKKSSKNKTQDDIAPKKIESHPKTRIQAVQESVKMFLESSSTHGLVYFLTNFSMLERMFWVIITAIMISMGAIWINTLRSYILNFLTPAKFLTVCRLLSFSQNYRLGWNESLPYTQNDDISTLTKNYTYPAITICSSYSLDRWGYLRDMLDEAVFRCNSNIEQK